MGNCYSCLSRRHHSLDPDKYPGGYPPPRPPSSRREQVFFPGELRSLDRSAAKKVPDDKMKGPPKEMADHITRRAETDLEKARALYVHLSHLDLSKLEASVNEDTVIPPEKSSIDHLLNVKWGLSNYAQLYSKLCQLVGVPCVVISGVCKNAHFRFGQMTSKDEIYSQWNAILIDHQWRLVDVCWGAACVLGKRTKQWAVASMDGDLLDADEFVSDGKTCFIQNDFYFMTDPDIFICTHLPDDRAWQLLPVPVRPEEFDSFVYVREQYFRLGFYMLESSHQEGTLNSKDGEVTISFGVPEDVIEDLHFSYLLYKTSVEGVSNKTLERTVIFRKTKNTVSYTVWFPVAGTFRLDIFARGRGQEVRFYDLICSYVLRCSSPKPGFERLPDAPGIGWGFGEAARKLGLGSPSHESPDLVNTDGKVNMTFTQSAPLAYSVELLGADGVLLSPGDYVIARSRDGTLSVDIRLPTEGQYALKMYASDPTTKGAMKNAVNYLIRYPSREEVLAPYQRTETGVLGSNVFLAKHLGVKAVSHKYDVIRTTQGKATLTFELKNPSSTDLMWELTHPSKTSVSLQDCVTVGPGTGDLQVDLSSSGVYGLNIYVRLMNEPERLHHVHSYVIQNDVPNDVLHQHDLQEETPYIPVSTLAVVNQLETIDNSHDLRHRPSREPVYIRCAKVNAIDAQGEKQIQTRKLDNGEYEITVQLPTYGNYEVGIYEQQGKKGCVKRCEDRMRIKKRPLTQEEQKTLRNVIGKWTSSGGGYKVYGVKGDVFVKAQLKIAMALKKPELLKVAVERFEARGLTDDQGVLERARKVVKANEIEKQLLTAMRGKGTEDLQKALKMAEDNCVEKELGLKLLIARRSLIGRFGDKLRKMDQTTFAEVKSYIAPPPQITDVVRAAILLLGMDTCNNSSETSARWENVRGMMGDTSKMKEKLKERRPEDINDDVVDQAAILLATVQGEDVSRISQTAGMFYNWSVNMIRIKQDQRNMREDWYM